MAPRPIRWLAGVPDPGRSVPYQVLWGVVAFFTACVSALAFVTVVDLLGAVTTLVAAVVLSISAGVTWAIALDGPWQASIRPSLAAAGLLVAFCGLSAAFGAWSLLLAPLVLTSPRALSGMLRLAASAGGGPRVATDSGLRDLVARRAWVDLEPADAYDDALPVPSALSVPGLCRVWRHTTAELEASPSRARRIELVALRADVLEEMALRDPRGFTRWLQAGPADCDPAGYLRRDVRTS